MNKKITKDTTLSEVLKHPRGGDILGKYKVPCLSCPFAQMEMENLKIGDICKIYEINLEAVLKDLNKTLTKEK